MKTLINLAIQVIAIMVAGYLIPGVTVASWTTALVFAVVLAVFSVTIKPIIQLITLPINLITLGLFGMVVNLALLYLAASLVAGISIAGLVPAILFSIVVGVVGGVLGSVL